MLSEGTGSYVLAMDPGAAQFARLAHFANVVAGDPAAVRLDEAALAMAAVLRARPTDGAAEVLDELAAGCTDRSFEGLRHHVFEDLGFAGDAEHYDEPRNSFLDVVVARRRGLPILLATVVIEVGRRSGVPCVGIGMPMHFLVRAADDEDAFIDPFSGEALDRLGARRRFEVLAGGRLPWDDGHLEPTPPRLIVLRMLTNLRASYERRADRVGLALVARMRAAIPELGAGASAEAVRLGAVFN
jgi:regulator of sirC expression with transglutaminase-like and TPR domain